MSKIKIKHNNFTVLEEIFNSIVHGFGSLFFLFGIFLIISKIINGSYSSITIISISIYMFGLLFLYLMSTLYHSLAKNKAKKVFRVLDHASIFVLIASSYTPFLLILTLKESYFISLLLLFFVWGVSILGIVFNSVNLEKYKKANMFFYFITGWIIVVLLPLIYKLLDFNGFMLLLAGGVMYTLGIIFFSFDKKVRFFHFIWHLFVLTASILHFLSIYLYLL